MNKKAFTLIELLGVIVLLSIIALIAIPLVLKSINNAEEKASLAEAEMILKGITDYCNGEDIKIRTGEIERSNRICKNSIDPLNVKKMVKNIKDETIVENISYSDGKVISLTVTNNEIIYQLDSDGNMVRIN